MARPMGKAFASGHFELGRNRRDSLDVFGQGAPQFSSSTTGPRFGGIGETSWNDASRSAEILLNRSESSGSAGVSGVGGQPREQVSGQVSSKSVEISLEDLIVELEAAEVNSEASPAEWEGVFKDSHSDSLSEKHNLARGYERRDRRSSDSGLQSEVPDVPPELISERAAQWGYSVVLKSSSRESTPRTSSGSGTGGRSSGGASAAVIPGVSKDVKDALSSFQLAFLVSDATHHDFPILYASAGFTTMTGYTADETVGKNCRFLQGPDTDRAEVARVREALREGKIYTGTLLNYKKDGTPFWNLLTISPIKDDGGKVIKYIGMQAEQSSKEQQPRNSKGQKSPIIGSTTVPPLVQNVDRPNSTGEASSAHRRHSSSSLPRPPVHPQKSPAPAERRSGSDVLREQQRRTSQRYSLTSNLERNTRNSSVEECDPDWREAVVRFRAEASLDAATKVTFESPETNASEEKSLKGKSNRFTSRIRRLFKKDKLSKRREKQFSVKDDFEFSDSGDERDDSADYSAPTSRTPRNSSSVYAPFSRSAGQPVTLEPSMNAVCDRLTEQINNNRGQSPTSPQYEGGKRQFCIVHT